jgi:hypothetical protein
MRAMRSPLCVGVATAAVLSFAPVATPAGSTETIQLISITTYSHQEPTDVKSGDYSVDSRDDLMNAAPQFGRRSGVRVGTDVGRFTYTPAHIATYTGVTRLPGGTVKVRGMAFAHDGKVLIRVVGGSGKYKGATGFLTIGVGPAKSKTRSTNTYELTLPLLTGTS